MSTDWDLLIENHFDRKNESRLTLQTLNESISEVLQEMENSRSFLISEKTTGGRFSMTIPVPKLVPTEAWGDPSSMSREEINKIFNVFRRGGSVRDRINQINSFLSPAEAKRKAPGGKVNTLLRMMQVIEALQAAINDYSEASAGFVFEGFMAALTNGREEAGRVGGTLPIEDFTAGDGENVSLKLLSPGTGIHGSFTNLIDYLFLRGDAGLPEIKYLVAYKDAEGENVSKLAIYDFEISRGNFVDVMNSTRNGKLLGKMSEPLKQHIASWQDTSEWRLQMANLLSQTPGYDKKRGMFIVSLDAEGNRVETEVEAGADLATKKSKQYQQRIRGGARIRLSKDTEAAGEAFARGEGPDFDTWYQQNIDDDLLASTGRTATSSQTKAKYKKEIEKDFKTGQDRAKNLSESFFGSFDLSEKRLIHEGKVSSTGGGAQWTITGTALQKERSVLRTNFYGELDLSQKNVDELSKIYIDKLGEDVMSILQSTKDFTENIGAYFVSDDRSKAMQANQKAQEDGKTIVQKLAAQTEPDTETE